MSGPEEDLDFCVSESVVEFFSNKMLYKKFYKMLSTPQKTATLVQILFRAAHTYSKDSKKRCLVNFSKNRAALVLTFRLKLIPALNLRSISFVPSLTICQLHSCFSVSWTLLTGLGPKNTNPPPKTSSEQE